MRRVRDVVVLVASAALALLIAGHALIPDVAGTGTLLDSVAPWLGLAIPLLLVAGLLARARTTVAVLAPTLAWCVLFGANLLPHASAASSDLRVVSQNLFAGNDDPASTAADLAATGADVIGVQELTTPARRALQTALGDDHPHHATIGTVGLWSRYPVDDVEPVDLGLDWTRAMRAQVHTPHGRIEVYVVHLPSLRPGSIDQRNRALSHLADVRRADDSPRAIVLGDFNTATDDRAMRLLPPKVRPVQQDTGSGFGFTWPATLPVVRLDHILQCGLRPTNTEVIRTHGSDHRAVLADFAK
ncbi:vancomycin resistance protein VanJ [Saccharopolyspora shandongensis]|uniref:Vancomycin resistance protein VanJ n=1 Tax=Saccharopolyspora shandongensis TaxID=418495 RepID=A0A1H3Q3W3_9PSEU|nr:endonuclease/exonuclease/phosphatase family protein [Saccharopolyspora shandongensis]SDZ07871.1 vancomycin resistance protein VanJ [Saccharopolyspora shandongensis]